MRPLGEVATKVRFGVFELDIRSGELRKSGAKIKLQEQPLRVLAVLLQHRGEMVSREELRARVWPEMSFGDLDHAINVAIAKLRAALGDAAETPRFIETVARRGYRFIAPVNDTQAETETISTRGSLWARRVIAGSVLAALIIAGVFGGAIFSGRHWTKSPSPTIDPITFRRGTIRLARLAPDGQTVVYSASWDGNPVEVFTTRLRGPESRSLGLPGAEILAVASSGEMALLLGSRPIQVFANAGTLARAPLAGGTPHEVLEGVQWADWSPDGSALAVVRDVVGRNRLEFPIGRILFDTAGWISHPRISPSGDLVAFLEHPLQGDDLGSVAVVDRTGKKTTLSSGWNSIYGLAWPRDGREVWFTATKSGASRALYAVNLSGRERLLWRVPEMLTLQDIGPDGLVLLAHDVMRRQVFFSQTGQNERNLSWLDWPVPMELSPDGKLLLFFESAQAAGPITSVYIRPTDGSPPVRIGEGTALTLSPDGKWVIAQQYYLSPAQFVLLPTKAGEPRSLTHDSISHVWAHWLPDGNRFLFSGAEPGHGVRFYVQDVGQEKPLAVTPEGMNATAFSVAPDGRLLAALGSDGKGFLFSLAGGKPHQIPGWRSGDLPVGWTSDQRQLYVYRLGELPAKVYKLNVSSGERNLWKLLMPADAAGVHLIHPVLLTADARAYVYGVRRIFSELYVVRGIR